MARPEGKEHREKAGTKSAARSLYQARKAAVLQGQKLPELGRRPLLVSDIIDRYLPEFVTNKKNADDDNSVQESVGAWDPETAVTSG